MNKKSILAIVLSIAILGTAFSQISGSAKNQEVEQQELQSDIQGIPAPMLSTVKYKYSAKFVCGDGYASNGIVAPAEYFTAINIHSPQSANVTLYKRVVIALPEEQMYMPPGQQFRYTIKPDHAFEIDCQDIKNLGQITYPFSKGFVIIDSPKQLDVVGVYTSLSKDSSTTLDVETVTPKAIIPSISSVAADLPVD